VTEPSAGQARDLVRLVELEARWENLPQAPAFDGPGAAVADLRARQSTYEAFAAARDGYNRSFRPAHESKAVLGNLKRLAQWLRATRGLLQPVEHDPVVGGPIHLVRKAYRLAARVAARVGEEPVQPADPPSNVGDAIAALDGLVRWCDEVTGRGARSKAV
jgi:hypothetical protein